MAITLTMAKRCNHKYIFRFALPLKFINFFDFFMMESDKTKIPVNTTTMSVIKPIYPSIDVLVKLKFMIFTIPLQLIVTWISKVTGKPIAIQAWTSYISVNPSFFSIALGRTEIRTSVIMIQNDSDPVMLDMNS